MSDSQVLEEEQVKEEKPKRVLSNFDCCDQCGHQAFFHATFEFGDLLFCRHHYYRNEAFIYDNALDLVDESEFI